jgi:hypothetical protein
MARIACDALVESPKNYVVALAYIPTFSCKSVDARALESPPRVDFEHGNIEAVTDETPQTEMISIDIFLHSYYG